jgi:hypothetical protein
MALEKLFDLSTKFFFPAAKPLFQVLSARTQKFSTLFARAIYRFIALFFLFPTDYKTPCCD